jgi:hypothetical protein
MRSLVYGLATAGLLMAQQSLAQQQCPSTTDQLMFEMQALKSELMVLATSCAKSSQYNAFVNRYQAGLAANEQAFQDYFKRRYGKQGQRELDSYVTALANAQSDGGMRLGSDFCPRNSAIFDEVLGLRGPGDLPQYAASKDLVPASLGACTEPPPPATPAKRGRTRTAHKG